MSRFGGTDAVVPSLLAVPNLLSFSRILVAPVIYALVVSGSRYGFLIAALLFVAASVTDTLDGEIARRRHLVSPDRERRAQPLRERALTTAARSTSAHWAVSTSAASPQSTSSTFDAPLNRQ